VPVKVFCLSLGHSLYCKCEQGYRSCNIGIGILSRRCWALDASRAHFVRQQSPVHLPSTLSRRSDSLLAPSTPFRNRNPAHIFSYRHASPSSLQLLDPRESEKANDSTHVLRRSSPCEAHRAELHLTCCRETADGKEAEDGRVQGVPWVHDAEDGVLIDQLEDGADLRDVVITLSG